MTQLELSDASGQYGFRLSENPPGPSTLEMWSPGVSIRREVALERSAMLEFLARAAREWESPLNVQLLRSGAGAGACVAVEFSATASPGLERGAHLGLEAQMLSVGVRISDTTESAPGAGVRGWVYESQMSLSVARVRAALAAGYREVREPLLDRGRQV